MRNVQNSPAPFFDIQKELNLHKNISKLIQQNKINSAHDVSDGGLYITLIESAMSRGLGFDIFTDHDFRQDAYLFGESQSRVVVSVSEEKKKSFEKLLNGKIHFAYLGQVTNGKIVIDDMDFGSIELVKEEYMSSLEKYLD